MKTALLFLVLLFNFACNYTSVEETKLQSLPQSTISPTPTQTEEKLTEVNEDVVYSVVLSSIVSGRDKYDESISSYRHTDWFDPRAVGNWMAVRRQTVSPENLDEIKSFSDLPEDLIGDFIEKNKTKENLRKDGYDVKFGVDVMDIKGSLESFFKAQDRKAKVRDDSWTLKAIVGVSRIGFTKSHKQSLVFVEFYHPITGLQKKYCLITWKKEGVGIMGEDIKFF